MAFLSRIRICLYLRVVGANFLGTNFYLCYSNCFLHLWHCIIYCFSKNCYKQFLSPQLLHLNSYQRLLEWAKISITIIIITTIMMINIIVLIIFLIEFVLSRSFHWFTFCDWFDRDGGVKVKSAHINQIGDSPTQNGWNDIFKAIAAMMTNMFELNNVPVMMTKVVVMRMTWWWYPCWSWWSHNSDADMEV